MYAPREMALMADGRNNMSKNDGGRRIVKYNVRTQKNTINIRTLILL
jgi:hypothetical protein